jgi:hypothetical protein
VRAVEFFEKLCRNYQCSRGKETNLNEISHKFSTIKSNSIKILTQSNTKSLL